jgi:hypothetical protein
MGIRATESKYLEGVLLIYATLLIECAHMFGATCESNGLPACKSCQILLEHWLRQRLFAGQRSRTTAQKDQHAGVDSGIVLHHGHGYLHSLIPATGCSCCHTFWESSQRGILERSRRLLRPGDRVRHYSQKPHTCGRGPTRIRRPADCFSMWAFIPAIGGLLGHSFEYLHHSNWQISNTVFHSGALNLLFAPYRAFAPVSTSRQLVVVGGFETQSRSIDPIEYLDSLGWFL